MPMGSRESFTEQRGAGRDVRRMICWSWLKGGACRWVVMLYKIVKVGYTAALLLGLAAGRSYAACESGLIAKELR